MKTRVEIPIIIETKTDVEYYNIMERIDRYLKNIPQVVEVDQAIGEDVDE